VKSSGAEFPKYNYLNEVSFVFLGKKKVKRGRPTAYLTRNCRLHELLYYFYSRSKKV